MQSKLFVMNAWWTQALGARPVAVILIVVYFNDSMALPESTNAAVPEAGRLWIDAMTCLPCDSSMCITCIKRKCARSTPRAAAIQLQEYCKSTSQPSKSSGLRLVTSRHSDAQFLQGGVQVCDICLCILSITFCFAGPRLRRLLCVKCEKGSAYRGLEGSCGFVESLQFYAVFLIYTCLIFNLFKTQR